ncbi:MAG: mechanosensitive ion channel family protein [Planctomycetes bacterium]|nr:mechanosensitive ion channel family protein [Planctomycetota bacterium]
MTGIMGNTLATADSWYDIINYQLVRGNSIWRFALVLAVILITMVVGKIVQYAINGFADKREKKVGPTGVTSTLKALTKPIYVGIFAMGLKLCMSFLHFSDVDGIPTKIVASWSKIAEIVGAIAVVYALYCLVEVIEYYLGKLVSKTETKLDDMLVPIMRKSIRITIAIIGALYIAQFVVKAETLKSVFLGAGIGGIAIAMAAKDTIANFFGSITIFTDRPFQIDELIRVNGHLGVIREVGFRSTRIQTLEGNLITIPNNTMANTDIENVSKRPYIRRTSNLTITYDSGCDKTKKAVEIVKDVLANTPEVNHVASNPPRVYFSDFNDWSLNIYMTYWVVPADFWVYNEVNEKVNFELMKRFEAEGIDFAFPTQTIYTKKDDNPS